MPHIIKHSTYGKYSEAPLYGPGTNLPPCQGECLQAMLIGDLLYLSAPMSYYFSKHYNKEMFLCRPPQAWVFCVTSAFIVLSNPEGFYLNPRGSSTIPLWHNPLKP